MNQIFIDQIDAILPQTQCRKCGYSGCRPYAEAIVAGQADINQCPPGDQSGIDKIARILGIATKPLNLLHGMPKSRKVVAWIDESLCIGCTFCSKACPVDAIVGAAKQMHTVIATECTGCELCVAPCPMDCISMLPVNEEIKQQTADKARLRYQFRQQRLVHEQRAEKKNRSKISEPTEVIRSSTEIRKQTIIATALKRAAAIRAQKTNNPDS